jgi:hypothetical protein
VADRGVDFALLPAHEPDVILAERILYGSSDAVPSRLSEPSSGPATVIITASDGASDGAPDILRAVKGLRRHAPAGTSLVLVANAPAPDAVTAFDRLEREAAPGLEVAWTSVRLGPAAALNIGLRRASGAIVIVLDAGSEPVGDIVTPLCSALDDPTVALAGVGGLAGTDVRHLDGAPAGDVVALDSACLAMRRADVNERGPLDERFATPDLLATWWSLVLRDEGEAAPPRRAVALGDLPIVRHGRASGTDDPTDLERRRRRDRYRLLDLVRDRPWLLGGGAAG